MNKQTEKKHVSFEFNESSLTQSAANQIELPNDRVLCLPKNCKHLHITVRWRLFAMETRYEPAEYIGRAQCDDCGEEMEPEDVSDEAERKDVTE